MAKPGVVQGGRWFLTERGNLEDALDAYFPHRNIPYKTQLAALSNGLNQTVNNIASGSSNGEVKTEDIIPTVPNVGYERKVSIGLEKDDSGVIRPGIRVLYKKAEKDVHYLIPLSECSNVATQIVKAAEAAAAFLTAKGFDVYDERRSQDLYGLRFLMNEIGEIIMTLVLAIDGDTTKSGVKTVDSLKFFAPGSLVEKEGKELFDGAIHDRVRNHLEEYVPPLEAFFEENRSLVGVVGVYITWFDTNGKQPNSVLPSYHVTGDQTLTEIVDSTKLKIFPHLDDVHPPHAFPAIVNTIDSSLSVNSSVAIIVTDSYILQCLLARKCKFVRVLIHDMNQPFETYLQEHRKHVRYMPFPTETSDKTFRIVRNPHKLNVICWGKMVPDQLQKLYDCLKSQELPARWVTWVIDGPNGSAELEKNRNLLHPVFKLERVVGVDIGPHMDGKMRTIAFYRRINENVERPPRKRGGSNSANGVPQNGRNNKRKASDHKDDVGVKKNAPNQENSSSETLLPKKRRPRRHRRAQKKTETVIGNSSGTENEVLSHLSNMIKQQQQQLLSQMTMAFRCALSSNDPQIAGAAEQSLSLPPPQLPMASTSSRDDGNSERRERRSHDNVRSESRTRSCSNRRRGESALTSSNFRKDSLASGVRHEDRRGEGHHSNSNFRKDLRESGTRYEKRRGEGHHSNNNFGKDLRESRARNENRRGELDHTSSNFRKDSRESGARNEEQRGERHRAINNFRNDSCGRGAHNEDLRGERYSSNNSRNRTGQYSTLDVQECPPEDYRCPSRSELGDIDSSTRIAPNNFRSETHSRSTSLQGLTTNEFWGTPLQDMTEQFSVHQDVSGLSQHMDNSSFFSRRRGDVVEDNFHKSERQDREVRDFAPGGSREMRTEYRDFSNNYRQTTSERQEFNTSVWQESWRGNDTNYRGRVGQDDTRNELGRVRMEGVQRIWPTNSGDSGSVSQEASHFDDIMASCNRSEDAQFTSHHSGEYPEERINPRNYSGVQDLRLLEDPPLRGHFPLRTEPDALSRNALWSSNSGNFHSRNDYLSDESMPQTSQSIRPSDPTDPFHRRTETRRLQHRSSTNRRHNY